MKDRFKFRVWDNNKKEYLDKGYIHRKGYLVMPTMKNDYSLAEAEGDFVIEQCTRLKDKNGKLIYEGDVIRVPYIDPIFYGVWNKENTEKSVVEFYKGCWIVRYLCDNKKIIYLYDFEDKGEVIGNIHENPELLEKEDE